MFFDLPTPRADFLTTYLTDDLLQAIDSEYFRSIYTYKCGCVVERVIPSGRCSLQACALHRRLTLDRGTR